MNDGGSVQAWLRTCRQPTAPWALWNTHDGAATYDPNLVQQASGLALGIDFTNGVRLTMLIVSVLPLAVAVLAYFLMPRRAPS